MTDVAAADRRLPPGQHVVARPPVLHIGDIPKGDAVDWKLRIHGAVERPMDLDWSSFQMLAMQDLVADFHAACGWSALELRWRGVALAELAERVGVKSAARFVRFFDGDLYDTTLLVSEALGGDVLLAHLVNDATIAREHGGPVRLVVSTKYGWKSVKWLCEIEFLADDRPGFWERRGRPTRADPWLEERGF